MSELMDALEFIETWVQRNMPEHPAVMAQGLTQTDIEAQTKDVPFQLSEELGDLYQWKNGGQNPFVPHPDAWDLANFFSLKEAISMAYDWQGSVIFPLFMVEDTGYFTVCTPEKAKEAPIYCSDMPEEAIAQDPRYPSLTTMMQELAVELEGKSC